MRRKSRKEAAAHVKDEEVKWKAMCANGGRDARARFMLVSGSLGSLSIRPGGPAVKRRITRVDAQTRDNLLR